MGRHVLSIAPITYSIPIMAASGRKSRWSRAAASASIAADR
jgi:hypothetical protein